MLHTYEVELVEGAAGVCEEVRDRWIVDADSVKAAIEARANPRHLRDWKWSDSKPITLDDPEAANASGKHCHYYMATVVCRTTLSGPPYGDEEEGDIAYDEDDAVNTAEQILRPGQTMNMYDGNKLIAKYRCDPEGIVFKVCLE